MRSVSIDQILDGVVSGRGVFVEWSTQQLEIYKLGIVIVKILDNTTAFIACLLEKTLGRKIGFVGRRKQFACSAN